VPTIDKLAAALLAVGVAACLAGCAYAPPGSIEEQLWFDKPIGGEINDVSPAARVHGLVGYPRTGCCGHPGPVLIREP
jgi:hypothetical protein